MSIVSINAAVLLHGGTPARRALLSQQLRVAQPQVRVRVSSRAAEAAKCLADPAVLAVFLIDAPDDASIVRANAMGRGLTQHVYDLEPRDAGEVVATLVRNALAARTQD